MSTHTIELCPKVNRGAWIHKSIEEYPVVKGYEVPIMPTTCNLVPFKGWEIPLMPSGGCPEAITELRWKQESCSVYTGIGPCTQPTNYWRFSCEVPSGLFEGLCSKCFPRAAVIYLVGNLGFKGGSQVTYGDRVTWRIHRNDLPFPGEAIFALAFSPYGEGDAYIAKGKCAFPQCGALPGDCIWSRSVVMQTSGTYVVVAGTYFATPTWTGGKLLDYFTEAGGWANTPAGSLTFPPCNVYGDPTLQYSIDVEGSLRNVTSVGFAGYGIGTHVLLKKLGIKHNEPFSDSCLGVSEGVPEEYIEYEKIGESDGTFQPSLSKISKLPFNLNNPITVFTNYDLFYSHAWHTEYMSVSVDANGLCSGDCTLGQLNMRTGVWEEDISWTNIPNADGQNAKIEIVIQYTKAEEPCTGVVVVPWHVMGVGG